MLDSDNRSLLGKENERLEQAPALRPDLSADRPRSSATERPFIPYILPPVNSPTGPSLLSGFLSATSATKHGPPAQSEAKERVIDHDAGDAAYVQSKEEPACKDPKPRPVPCNLALRFTNRPNGTQLTTIVEQRSYSTLSSLPSLISTPRRYTSGQLDVSHSASTLSPNTRCHESASRRGVSKSLDEVTLHRVYETARQRQGDEGVATHDAATQSPKQLRSDIPNNPRVSHSDATAEIVCELPASPIILPLRPKPTSQGGPLVKALRTLFATVRKVPRHTHSLSALNIHPDHNASVIRSLRSRGASEPSTKGDLDRQAHRRKRAVHEPNVTGSFHAGYNLVSAQPTGPVLWDKTVKDESTTAPSSDPSAVLLNRYQNTKDPAITPTLTTPIALKSGLFSSSSTNLLILPQTRHHVKEDPAITPTSTTPIVLKPDPFSSSPTPSPSEFPAPPLTVSISTSRFRNTNSPPITISPTSPLSLSSRGRDDEGARYTFDGVLLYRSNAPSLHNYDRSRTTSGGSCTSASSSILGLDDKIHFENIGAKEEAAQFTARPHHSRASTSTSRYTNALDCIDNIQNAHSTPAPSPFYPSPNPTTWLTSTTPPLLEPTHIKTHTLTSAALPVLLPLAAAHGIIRTSHTCTPSQGAVGISTCVTSFHSPSGNLIRVSSDPDDSDPARRAVSSFQTPLEPLARVVVLPAHAGSPPASYPLPKWLRRPAGREAVEYRPLSRGAEVSPGLPIRTHFHPRAVVWQSVEREQGVGSAPPRVLKHLKPVHGCGGEVRAASLQPRSGVPYAPRLKTQRGERVRGNVMRRIGYEGVDGTVDDVAELGEGGFGVKDRVGEGVGRALRVCFCQPKP